MRVAGDGLRVARQGKVEIEAQSSRLKAERGSECLVFGVLCLGVRVARYQIRVLGSGLASLWRVGRFRVERLNSLFHDVCCIDFCETSW